MLYKYFRILLAGILLLILASSSQATLPPLLHPVNFNGVDLIAAGGSYPPGTHGAVGLNHFVQVTNSHLDIYQRIAPPKRVVGRNLASFFNYATQPLLDPRVLYDAVADRWIISANAFAESATMQKFFVAASQTGDPTGSWYIYQVNVSNGSGAKGEVQWQFPQMGLDANAVIFTANFFTPTGTLIDARLFTVAKSTLYSGPSQALSPVFVIGLHDTLAPPIVLDTNTSSFLVAADDIAANQVWIYTLTNSASNPPTVSSPTGMSVTAFTAPPPAPQPGTSATLDTADCRFINASTQIGNSLFQIHTVNISGYARPRFYEFDTVNKVVLQSGTFSRSATSHDFNAAIAANSNKDVFVTWSATDPTNSINAAVHFSGRLHDDAAGVIPGPGQCLFTSTTALTGNPFSEGDTHQRWGRCSALSLDPSNNRGMTIYVFNETILTSYYWGTRIGRFAPPSFLPAVYMLLLMGQ